MNSICTLQNLHVYLLFSQFTNYDLILLYNKKTTSMEMLCIKFAEFSLLCIRQKINTLTMAKQFYPLKCTN